MKKLINRILFLILTLLLGCTDVVDVDLDTAPPKLVIEASIDWIKGTSGNEQIVKLHKTTDYYNTTSPTVSGATIYIINSLGDVFDFIEDPGSGEYKCTNFASVLNETYVLSVEYDGEVYTATEKLFPVPDIEADIEQSVENDFGDDVIEIKFYYQDDGSDENYYMDRFESNRTPFPLYSVASDELFQGNQMFGSFSNEDITAGDIVNIKLHGISERYNDYMSKLLEAAEGGGPFGAIPVTVRGNIINQTDDTNYALGYFRLSEVVTVDYTVQ